MKVQFEITTSCNLSCEYCFRKREFSFHASESIAEKLTDFDEIVVYGYGEPLLYPNIRKTLEMFNGKILLSTNGMIDENFDEILAVVDRIGISMDFDARHRKGLVFRKLEEKLKKAGEKAVAQIVITKDNIKHLSELVEISAVNGASIQLTNVVAGDREMYGKALYFEGSRFCVEAVGDVGSDFVLSAIKDFSRGGGKKAEEYRKLLRMIYGEGYSINIPYIVESRERIETAMKAEKIVENAESIARSYGVEFERAEFFGDWKNRECPYEDMFFVRFDGLTSTCMSFAYSHMEFVNEHSKSVNSFHLGNLRELEVDDVLENLNEFNNLRKSLSKNFPWCADCPHVSGCWYAKQNIDCYGNELSCSECLYSARISRCLL